MKDSHTCPKCHHTEVLYVPQLADRDDARNVRPIMIHVQEYDWKDVELGKLEAYVCRRCGFTELYTVDAGAIPVEKIPGAKLLRAKSPTRSKTKA